MSHGSSFPRKRESTGVVRLGDVCRIQNGFAFDSARFADVGGMPLIRIRDINKGRCSVNFIGDYDDEFVVWRGDILVGMDGEFNIAEWRGEPALLNQRVCRLVAQPGRLDSTFLLHRIKQELKRIEDETPSTTVKHLSSRQIANISFQLPDVADQRRVASRLKAQLADVDTARQAAQAQVREAELLRQRLLRQAFATVEAMPRKVLGECARTTSGSTPPRGDRRYWSPAEIPWVKTGEVAFAPITRTEESVSRQALRECSLTLLPPGSVLIAMYGQGRTRGQSAILEVEATTNQACFAILPNQTWGAEFLHYWLMASYEELRQLSEGRGGNQANLNGALLNSLEVPAPSHTDQRHLVTELQARLAEATAIAQAAAAQLAEIERLPPRLLAQAFAGRA